MSRAAAVAAAPPPLPQSCKPLLVSLVLLLLLFPLARAVCSIQQFECSSGECLAQSQRCDGINNCADDSDEQGCVVAQCKGNQFSCANGICIPANWRCDGTKDCEDSSDEIACPPRACAAHEHMCSDLSTCIEKVKICDGINDCPDQSDESILSCLFRTPLCSPQKEFRCNNGHCVPKREMCDKVNDCGDNSDETAPECFECRPEEYKCPTANMANGTTATKVCIARHKMCDSRADCPDGSDEHQCSPVRCLESKEFACANQLECIELRMRCDNTTDCADGSDEVDCATTELAVTTSTTTTTTIACAPDTVLAEDGRCEPIDTDLCTDASACLGHECETSDDEMLCHCAPGYSLDHGADGQPECLLATRNYSLLYSTGTELLTYHWRQPSRRVAPAPGDHKLLTSFFHHQPRLVDYNFDSNYYVVVNIGEHLIADRLDRERPLRLDGVSTPFIVIKNNTQVCSMALHWLDDIVVYINCLSGCIESIKLTRPSQMYVLVEGVANGRDIVANPIDGWFVWSEAGNEPKIERVGIDGHNRMLLVDEALQDPVALTIDYLLGRIYWLDAGMGAISSVDFNGEHRWDVLESRQSLLGARRLDVFDAHLYWIAPNKHAVLYYDKFGSNNSVVHKLFAVNTSLDSMVVVSAFKQPRPPPPPRAVSHRQCTPSACAYACSPSTGRCLCPLHHQLLDSHRCVPAAGLGMSTFSLWEQLKKLEKFVLPTLSVFALILVLTIFWPYVTCVIKSWLHSRKRHDYRWTMLPSRATQETLKTNASFDSCAGMVGQQQGKDQKTIEMRDMSRSGRMVAEDRHSQISSGYSSFADAARLEVLAPLRKAEDDNFNDDDEGKGMGDEEDLVEGEGHANGIGRNTAHSQFIV